MTVFTASKGLPGAGFSHAEWNAIKDMQSGTVARQVSDTTLAQVYLPRLA